MTQPRSTSNTEETPQTLPGTWTPSEDTQLRRDIMSQNRDNDLARLENWGWWYISCWRHTQGRYLRLFSHASCCLRALTPGPPTPLAVILPPITSEASNQATGRRSEQFCDSSSLPAQPQARESVVEKQENFKI